MREQTTKPVNRGEMVNNILTNVLALAGFANVIKIRYMYKQLCINKFTQKSHARIQKVLSEGVQLFSTLTAFFFSS